LETFWVELYLRASIFLILSEIFSNDSGIHVLNILNLEKKQHYQYSPLIILKMKVLILFLFLFLGGFSYSQETSTLEDFERELSKYPKDSIMAFARINILLAAIYIDSDPKGFHDEIELNLNYSFDLLKFYQKKYKIDEESFYWIGLSLFYLEDYRSAVVEFSKAIELNPNNLENYRMRGYCKNELKDFYGSERDFLKAISLSKPSYEHLEDLYAVRGGCLIDIFKFENGKEENVKIDLIDESMRCYDKAISLNSKEGFYHFQKGFLYGIKGDEKSACLSLSKAGELGYMRAYEMIEKHCTHKD